MDLIIRNARLADAPDERLTDIGIEAGRFVRIEPGIRGTPKEEFDAGGRLLSPPLIDSHVHLDAALTVGEPRFNESGTLLEGIQIWEERKKTLTKEDVKARALEAIKWEVAQGTLFIRSHVDVCDPDLTALKALVELREEVRDIVDLQLVAFPQDGIHSFPGGLELMERAIKLGADVVGGIPHYEATRKHGEESLGLVFDLARRYGKLVDCHTDETDDPISRFTEVMADGAVREGMGERVTASHCTAMHSYDNAYAFKLIRLIAKSGMNVVANPFDNVVLQGRSDTYPKRRGMTRVKELLEAGVNVSLGHDSIMDPWYPLGRGDMLSAASLALHVLQMSGQEEINEVFELVTNRAARTLGVADLYGIEEGKPASFVVFDAPSPAEALRLNPARLRIVKDGRLVASTEPSRSTLLRGGISEEVRFSPSSSNSGRG